MNNTNMSAVQIYKNEGYWQIILKFETFNNFVEFEITTWQPVYILCN
jgi:hypothetical protein